MKRDQFIKTLAALTGGLTVVGCSPYLIDEMVAPGEVPGDLGIGEAEDWFNGEYLSRFSGLQNERRGKAHRRNAAWKKAQKPKNKKNRDFGWVWVPLDYSGNERPAVVLYDEQTRYKLELSQYFQQPIIEGLIVMKVGGVNKAFLAQIAYDPFALAANGYKLEKSSFTGTLIRSDWDDTPIDGSTFVDGKMVDGFSNPDSNSIDPGSANSRIEDCGSLYMNYVTVTTVFVNNEYQTTIENHNSWISVCVDGSGNGGWSGGGGCGVCNGNDGGGYGSGGGGGGAVYQSDSGGGYYDPLVNSGAGATFPTSTLHGFNLDRAIATDGTDRMKMNANLKNALFATELATGITTWTYAKADALSRAAGLNLTKSYPLIYKGLTRIGVASAAYGVYQAILVFQDGGELTTDEMITLGAAAIGVASIFVTGWIAVGVGAVSIGITIYQERASE